MDRYGGEATGLPVGPLRRRGDWPCDRSDRYGGEATRIDDTGIADGIDVLAATSLTDQAGENGRRVAAELGRMPGEPRSLVDAVRV